MGNPHISVIIPCYNMEKYLSECLDSVVQQTLKNIEIICIDDGSKDQTPAILDRYQNADSRVTVIHQANLGVAESRNKGIARSSGEYVIFMDPDDFYPDSETLELLYTKAKENGALICGGSFSSYNDSIHKVSTHYTGDFAKYTFTSEGFIPYSDYQFDYGYHRFIYSRNMLNENRITFPLYARFQDPPFFVQAMLAAKEFYAVPNVVYRYRCGFQDKPTSWPRTKLHDMMRGHLDNLVLSREAGLAQLHGLTVRRFEADNVFEPVMKSLAQKDPVTLDLLNRINAAINPAMLSNCGMAVTEDNCYVLRQFQLLLNAYSTEVNTSPSFVVRILRLISRGIKCCRDHGFFYTVRFFMSKVKKKMKNKK